MEPVFAGACTARVSFSRRSPMGQFRFFGIQDEVATEVRGRQIRTDL
jgi:hypothetical protein